MQQIVSALFVHTLTQHCVDTFPFLSLSLSLSLVRVADIKSVKSGALLLAGTIAQIKEEQSERMVMTMRQTGAKKQVVHKGQHFNYAH